MPLGFAIEFRPSDTALCAHPSAFGVDMNSLHLRKIDHYADVDRCAPCHIMTTATDRDFKNCGFVA